MAVRCIKREQFLPISVEEAWNFFSNPLNLSKIKPDDMKFEILSTLPEKIYPGLFIHYLVSPVMSIPLRWTTEITQAIPQQYFIDEQRCGPFHIWHHEHHFKAVEGGTLMSDILHYHIGKGIFGAFAAWLFVDRKVEWIFNFRYKKINSLFNPNNNLTAISTPSNHIVSN